MTITETTSVAEIAAALPASVRVFHEHGIDFCCGGKRALGDVCLERGLSFETLAASIREAASAGTVDERDWAREPLHLLIDHIVGTYHDALREQLPRFSAWAAKAVRAHGAKSPAVAHIQEVLDELAADLDDHMRKEELVLFPAICSLENGERRHAAWIAGPMTVMEQEHDRAGALLAELRRSTGDYAPPAWACATVKALYRGLEDLERSMHLHVHLENNVLFPRARATAERSLAGA